MLNQRPPWWKSALQFAVGIGLIVAIGIIAFLLWPRPGVPTGWLTVRPPQDVMALVEYEDAVWAGGRDGLVVIDRATGELLQQVEFEEALDFVSSIVLDPSGESLWVGHLNGLTHIEGNAWRTFTTSEGLVDNQILSLGFDLVGGLWIGTVSGVMRYDGQSFSPAPENVRVLQGPVSVIYLDQDGQMWFGNGFSTSGGLAMFDGANWHGFSIEDGLVHHMVNTLLEDDEGVLWIGAGFSNLGGATLLDDDEIRVLTSENGLAGAKVRSLFQDGTHTMWVGSEYNGIAYRNGENWSVLTPKDGLSGWEVKVMLQDSEMNLWLGTENGLTRIERAAWERLVGDK